ncbi:MAG: hypothetical protein P5702_06500 [Limnospira sp. PMC 1291.21]|uniref:Uncharacterized protein n=2 Tax=Limnospira TaxID=2596745 RepID=A0A9P1KCP4_9CYAN|nr:MULTISPECIES: hypothetical protein [Limnospira]MDC0839026.1 hypothetical protein [Limnoraphis robusta]MDY7053702.1 hypothetical protein [Limnospira fusiformis LS22]QJB28183.1 hypothetical protein HFV01_23335 [Limnospira fusiformis SAG 85.79]CDM93171.1 protein of unknown function [Limnospira indica PCC 8005]MDT9177111.1 hypothetical protein [Limnospira sp. PMC 1238.20]
MANLIRDDSLYLAISSYMDMVHREESMANWEWQYILYMCHSLCITGGLIDNYVREPNPNLICLSH